MDAPPRPRPRAHGRRDSLVRACLGSESILHGAADLIHLLRFARAEGLGDLDRLRLFVAKRDHTKVGAGRLDHVRDLVAVASDLAHRLARHPPHAVFEVRHAMSVKQKARHAAGFPVTKRCAADQTACLTQYWSNASVSSFAISCGPRPSICQRSSIFTTSPSRISAIDGDDGR